MDLEKETEKINLNKNLSERAKQIFDLFDQLDAVAFMEKTK